MIKYRYMLGEIERFGQAVLDYFLTNYPEDNPFRLAIDDYTFSNIANNVNINEDHLIALIHQKETNFANRNQALAIAAYQVKIVGDLDFKEDDWENGYYAIIKSNYGLSKNTSNAEICSHYFKNQISMWKEVKALFDDRHRKLQIPEDHSGAGRYVQYPLKSHEITNTELIKYADQFKKHKILPNDPSISFSRLCSIISFPTDSESLRRIVFNFYRIWNGKSSKEIFNRKASISSPDTPSADDNCILIDLLQDRIDFIDKNTGEDINDYSLIRKRLFPMGTEILLFIQQDDAELFSMLKDNTINKGQDFLLLSPLALTVKDENCINRFIPDAHNASMPYAYFIRYSENLCNQFKIGIRPQAGICLIGGLRKSAKKYYNFALPDICFEKDIAYVYINNIRVAIDGRRLSLGSCKQMADLKEMGGPISICHPDYLQLRMEIIKPDADVLSKPEAIGWSLIGEKFNPSPLPGNETFSNSSIIGLYSAMNFNILQIHNSSTQNTRKFVDHINWLENRFVHLGGAIHA